MNNRKKSSIPIKNDIVYEPIESTLYNDNCINKHINYEHLIDPKTGRPYVIFVLFYELPEKYNSPQYAVMGLLKYKSGKEFSGNNGNTKDFNNTILKIKGDLEELISVRGDQPDIGSTHYNKVHQLQDIMEANSNNPFASDFKLTSECFDTFIKQCPQQGIGKTISKTVFVEDKHKLEIYDKPRLEGGKPLDSANEERFKKISDWKEQLKDSKVAELEGENEDTTKEGDTEEFKQITDILLTNCKNASEINKEALAFGRQNMGQLTDLTNSFIENASMKISQIMKIITPEHRGKIHTAIAMACAQLLCEQEKMRDDEGDTEEFEQITGILLTNCKNVSEINKEALAFGRQNMGQLTDLTNSFIENASIKLSQIMKIITPEDRDKMHTAIAMACAQFLCEREKMRDDEGRNCQIKSDEDNDQR